MILIESVPSTCIKMHFYKMSFGSIITMGAEPTTLYNPGNDTIVLILSHVVISINI